MKALTALLKAPWSGALNITEMFRLTWRFMLWLAFAMVFALGFLLIVAIVYEMNLMDESLDSMMYVYGLLGVGAVACLALLFFSAKMAVMRLNHLQWSPWWVVPYFTMCFVLPFFPWLVAFLLAVPTIVFCAVLCFKEGNNAVSIVNLFDQPVGPTEHKMLFLTQTVAWFIILWTPLDYLVNQPAPMTWEDFSVEVETEVEPEVLADELIDDAMMITE